MDSNNMMDHSQDERMLSLVGGEDELMIDEDAMYQSLSVIPVPKSTSWQPDMYQSRSVIPALRSTSQAPAQIALSKPLVLRPAVFDMPATEGISRKLSQVDITHAKPLVHRPAVPDVPVIQSEDASGQLALVAQPKPLHGPAVPEVVAQPSTVQQPPRTGVSYRNVRRLRVLRERRQKGRDREYERELLGERVDEFRRWRERERRPKSPSAIRHQMVELRMDLYRLCHGQEQLQDWKSSGERQYRHAIAETETFFRTLKSEVASGRAKRIKVMKDIEDLLSEEHPVEAWQKWGRGLVKKVDLEQDKWENEREERRRKERMRRRWPYDEEKKEYYANSKDDDEFDEFDESD